MPIKRVWELQTLIKYSVISSQPLRVIRSKSFLFSTGKLERETGAPSPSIDRSLTPLNMAAGMVFALSLILVIGHLQEGPGSLAKTFTFPEYPYKETTKNVSRLYCSSESSTTSGTCWTLIQVMESDPYLGVAVLRC